MSKVYTTEYDYGAPINISDHATNWLVLHDAKQQRLFDSFRCDQTSTNSVIWIIFLCSTYMFLNKFSGVYNYPSTFNTICFVFGGIIFPVFVGLFTVYLRLVRDRQKSFGNDPPSEESDQRLQKLESWWLVGSCIAFNLGIIIMGYNGQCKHDRNFLEDQGCNLNSPHQMPEIPMLISMLMPGFIALTMKSVKWGYVCFSFLINIGMNLFTMFYFDLRVSLPAFVLITPLCSLIMYENQRQMLSIFLITQSKQNLVEVNKKLAAETYASEMRRMIGNLAYDLKTPLNAFISGIDLITSVLEEPTMKELAKKTNTIKETVIQMKHTNQFMIMSINRCIDYTKSSSGMKLTPNVKSIDLYNTVFSTVDCIQSFIKGTQIYLKMNTISTDICSFILTDKQWLQENILCLLSNAVKYSAAGTVTLTVVQGGAIHETLTSKSLLRVEVEDAGIGIEEDRRATLFSPFKESQNRMSGTGLGLYSLAKRIEALGGFYGVQERKDGKQGSLFWFSIPYRPDITSGQMPSAPNTSDKTANSSYTPAVAGMQANHQRETLHNTSNSSSSNLMNKVLQSAVVIEPPSVSHKSQYNYSWSMVDKDTAHLSARTSMAAAAAQTPTTAVPNPQNALSTQPIPTAALMSPERLKRIELQKSLSFSRASISAAIITHNVHSTPLSTTIPTTATDNITVLDEVSVATPTQLSFLHILLVDDSRSVLKVTATMLRKKGHTVITAENGEIALRLMSEQLNNGTEHNRINKNSNNVAENNVNSNKHSSVNDPSNHSNNSAVKQGFDVVLMDLLMPVMDGLESTSRLRQLERSTQLAQYKITGSLLKTGVEEEDKVDGESSLFLEDLSNMADIGRNNNVENKSTPHQFIIGVSACCDTATINEAYTAGIDAFIHKPFTVQAFNETYKSLAMKYNRKL